MSAASHLHPAQGSQGHGCGDAREELRLLSLEKLSGGADLSEPKHTKGCYSAMKRVKQGHVQRCGWK